MTRLVLLRHGQSLWNQEGRFTGWKDIDLSPAGRGEASAAGRMMSHSDITFSVAYTSLLKRAIRTLWIVLDEMNLMWIPTVKSWRLNERAYGLLEGMSIKEILERYGPGEVHQWRKGFRSRPPLPTGSVISSQGVDSRYINLNAAQIPLSESLYEVQERLMPLWQDQIAVDLKRGRNVIIVSHGNTIRALMKHLERISDQEIEKVAVPTATPLVYELDRCLRPVEKLILSSEGELIKFKRERQTDDV